MEDEWTSWENSIEVGGERILWPIPSLPAFWLSTWTECWRIGRLVKLRPFLVRYQNPLVLFNCLPLLWNWISWFSTLTDRVKRQAPVTFHEMDLCGQTTPSCGPTQWVLRCRFTNSHCVYYLTCRVNGQAKQYECPNPANHESGRVLCCEARCPE